MVRAEVIYLDTHILIRLYLGEAKGLGKAARRAIDGPQLLASPAAVLELELLHEIGRMRMSALEILAALEHDLGLRVCDLSFQAVMECALSEKWGRDPFDRLIVANARARDAALVTKDEKILQHYPLAVWD
jgi:PIN domain nuclease of toxin-antitoxin system